MPEYFDRVVGFIDILGFKAWVATLNQDPTRASEIYTALKEPTRLEPFTSLMGRDIRIIGFSDSVILSGAPEDLYFVAMSLSSLQLRLLRLGLLSRGGIALGRAIHYDGIVFGEAVIKAWELEKVADNPKVLVDDASLGIPIKAHPSIVDRDSDGRVYIKPFAALLNSSGTLMLGEVRQAIVRGMAAAECPKHLARWVWTARQFNAANAARSKPPFPFIDFPN